MWRPRCYAGVVGVGVGVLGFVRHRILLCFALLLELTTFVFFWVVVVGLRFYFFVVSVGFVSWRLCKLRCRVCPCFSTVRGTRLPWLGLVFLAALWMSVLLAPAPGLGRAVEAAALGPG